MISSVAKVECSNCEDLKKRLKQVEDKCKNHEMYLIALTQEKAVTRIIDLLIAIRGYLKQKNH